MSGTNFRLSVLSRHLSVGAFPSDAPDANNLAQQSCAATSTLRYARPAAPDCLFAVPVQEAPSSVELEALGAATLQACRRPSKAQETTQNESLPLFARPDMDDELLGTENQPFSSLNRPLTRHYHEPGSGLAGGIEESPHGGVSSSGHWAPEASILESEFGYVMQVVLPGVRAQEVRAELLPGGRLVVTGVRHKTLNKKAGGGPEGSLPELLSALPRELVLGGKAGMGRVVYGGDVLVSGRFKLVWKLPKDANLESLRADFKDGCLLIGVSKKNGFSLG